VPENTLNRCGCVFPILNRHSHRYRVLLDYTVKLAQSPDLLTYPS